MITKTREQIKQDVRIIIDHNETTSILTGISDADQLEMNDIINKMIDVALVGLYKSAPADLLSEVAEKLTGATWNNSDSYCLRLPLIESFGILRILSVKCSGWEKPCTDIILGSEALYDTYRSKFTGIRPTKRYPGCAIVSGVPPVLEAYPKGADTNADVIVVKKTFMGSNGDVKVPSDLYDAFLYLIAKLYYVTLGDSQNAALMDAEVKELVGVTIDTQSAK